MTFEEVNLHLNTFNGGPRSSETYLAKHYPNIKQFISNLYPESSFAFNRLLIKRNWESSPKCKTCGKELLQDNPKRIKRFQDLSSDHMLLYCNCKCAGQDAERIEKKASRMRGKPGTMLGKKHTPEALKKMKVFSDRRRGQPGGNLGKIHSPETRAKISRAVRKRFKDDPEKYRAQCRLGWEHKLEKGFALSNVNPDSLPYLAEIQSWLDSECFYGKKERAIKVKNSGSGYRYPDFYCEELKLIIEWNEPRHYHACNRKKDLVREKELIKSLGKDWKILEIAEKEYTKLSYEEREKYIRENI